MIPDQFYEDEILELKDEISQMKRDINEMRRFFDKQSKPIIKKAVRNVEKQLRHFPQDALQFGDDSNLNFFEEVCVMEREGSTDDYLFVRSTIESCCEDAFNALSADEQFIIDHRIVSDFQPSGEFIADAFFSYALDYESNRINNAYERRCYG